MAIIDFRQANFTVSHENPFRLSSPREQAAALNSTNDAHSSPPDIAFSEALKLITSLYSQRVNQGKAFLSLLDAEIELVTKSAWVCVFAGLTAFALAGVCWLLLNVLLGLILHHFQLPLIGNIVTLLIINLSVSIWVFRQAQGAFKYINFKRLLSTIDALK